jgi:predicted nucleic acid-binding protein
MCTVRRLLTLFTVSWPTEADVIRAYMVYQPLRLSHGIGLFDCIVAATATGPGEDLATFNVKHFRAVPDLVTIQPYVR